MQWRWRANLTPCAERGPRLNYSKCPPGPSPASHLASTPRPHQHLLDQFTTGRVSEATLSNQPLPPLLSPRGQPTYIDRCLFHTVSLTTPTAHRLRLDDTRIEASDLANIDLISSTLDRVEILSTRLTGATLSESHLRSVLFRDCKLDLTLFRMTTLAQCVLENCNLTEADFYSADLSGTIFHDCNLSRADLSHADRTGADLRNCRLDGLRGTPTSLNGLTISPDEAPLLITLFGIRVAP